MSSAQVMGQARGALSAAAAIVGQAEQDLVLLDRELSGHVEAAAAGWVGRGGAAFSALGIAWSERHRVIVAALEHLGSSLRATEQDIEATDEAQSVAFARHQQRLG